jgi:hypothetical protein
MKGCLLVVKTEDGKTWKRRVSSVEGGRKIQLRDITSGNFSISIGNDADLNPDVFPKDAVKVIYPSCRIISSVLFKEDTDNEE